MVSYLPKVKLILYDWVQLIFIRQIVLSLFFFLKKKILCTQEWFPYLFRSRLFIQHEPSAR